MGRTHIVWCNRCEGLFLASDGQKTKTCPYCGLRVDTDKSKRLGTAEDAFTASEMLRELKTKKANG
jgi:rRNA maturation endonuclease Nob1